MADQTDDGPYALDWDAAEYILTSVVAPKSRWADEHHRRAVSMSRRFGWAALAGAVVTIAAYIAASPLWPVAAGIATALVVTRVVAERRLARSAKCLRSLATIEQALRHWLTTMPVSRQSRIDVLESCDLTSEAVLLQASGPFDRWLPASARRASAWARDPVVGDDWQPHLPALSIPPSAGG